MYPNIDPVAIALGPVKVHWYGLMYLLGFLFFLYVGKYQIKKYNHPILQDKMIDDMLFYGAMGVVIGGRLGYCFLYQPEYYLAHPVDIVKTWTGGMAFHGGITGVAIGMALFARKYKLKFLTITDFGVVLVPAGLFFGRIGNFINGELWGRICDQSLPWGMVFPASGSMLARHPSQLYEAALEGLFLGTLMFVYSAKPRKTGQISGLFLIVYGLIRFGLEFFREPDAFATGIVQATGLSLGQFYSFPMIIIGLTIFVLGSKNKFAAK